MSNLNFSTALEHAKAGQRIRRSGWNGKDQWVCVMSGLKLPPHNSTEPGPKVNARTAQFIGVDRPLDSQPYFVLKNQQGQWQPGWLASQADLLAEDWEVVE